MMTATQIVCVLKSTLATRPLPGKDDEVDPGVPVGRLRRLLGSIRGSSFLLPLEGETVTSGGLNDDAHFTREVAF